MNIIVYSFAPDLLSSEAEVQQKETYSLQINSHQTRPSAKMDIKQIVGQNLKRHRIAAGLSQEELAFECGIHRTYVSGVERGVRNPTVTLLARIAEPLGIEVAELLEKPDTCMPMEQ